MRIAIDVDDVVADLMDEWLYRWNVGNNAPLRREQITHWDLIRFASENIYDILSEPDLYLDVPPIQDAISAVKRLQGKYDVIFVTSCVHGAVDQKAEWLEKQGLIKNANRRLDPAFIVCSNKKLINADILIDDRLETIKEWPGKGIVFAQPWNELGPDNRYTRCNGWQETMKYLEEYCG